MWPTLWKDIAATHVFAGPPAIELVTEADLEALPLAALVYMNAFRITRVPGARAA